MVSVQVLKLNLFSFVGWSPLRLTEAFAHSKLSVRCVQEGTSCRDVHHTNASRIPERNSDGKKVSEFKRSADCSVAWCLMHVDMGVRTSHYSLHCLRK